MQSLEIHGNSQMIAGRITEKISPLNYAENFQIIKKSSPVTSLFFIFIPRAEKMEDE